MIEDVKELSTENSPGTGLRESTFYKSQPLSKVNQKNRIQLIIDNYILSRNLKTEMWTKEISSEITSNDKISRGTELVDRIHHLFKNPNNWDGYGTPQISTELQKKCYDILEQVCVHKFELPSIFPVCGGGLQFEWKHGERELELEFNEGIISVLRTEEMSDGEIVYREKEDVPKNEVPSLVQWVHNTQVQTAKSI